MPAKSVLALEVPVANFNPLIACKFSSKGQQHVDIRAKNDESVLFFALVGSGDICTAPKKSFVVADSEDGV